MKLKGGFCALALSFAVIISGSPALALDPTAGPDIFRDDRVF